MKDISRGKSFGAAKAVVLRLIGAGYRPTTVQLSATESARDRIRRYAMDSGLSMIDAVDRILDAAGVPLVDSFGRPGSQGRMASLVSAIIDRSGGVDPESLRSRIRDGEFDDMIADYNESLMSEAPDPVGKSVSKWSNKKEIKKS